VWFPLAGSVLAFDHADVTFEAATASFVARLLVRALVVDGDAVNEFAGGFAIRDGLAVTVVML
jgi:4'-phosphopantetheinyl transferase EntD